MVAQSQDQPIQDIQNIGDFIYIDIQDEFDDSDISLLSTGDVDREGLIWNYGEGLIWRCSSSGLRVILSMNTPMRGDSNNDVLVRYRFDDKVASEFEYWDLGRSKQDAFMKPESVASFTREALDSGKIILEALDPSDYNSFRFRFWLSGFSEALELLSCSDSEENPTSCDSLKRNMDSAFQAYQEKKNNYNRERMQDTAKEYHTNCKL